MKDCQIDPYGFCICRVPLGDNLTLQKVVISYYLPIHNKPPKRYMTISEQHNLMLLSISKFVFKYTTPYVSLRERRRNRYQIRHRHQTFTDNPATSSAPAPDIIFCPEPAPAPAPGTGTKNQNRHRHLGVCFRDTLENVFFSRT